MVNRRCQKCLGYVAELEFMYNNPVPFVKEIKNLIDNSSYPSYEMPKGKVDLDAEKKNQRMADIIKVSDRDGRHTNGNQLVDRYDRCKRNRNNPLLLESRSVLRTSI